MTSASKQTCLTSESMIYDIPAQHCFSPWAFSQRPGYGIESVRSWVRQADIDDGHVPGVSTSESARVKDLEQEIREPKRANEILKRAASFFGAELDRQHKK